LHQDNEIMKLNIKTKDGKVKTISGKVHEMEEVKFWEAFLKSLNINGVLGNKEVTMMSFILSQSPFKSFFKKPNLKRLLDFMNLQTYQGSTKYRQNLQAAKLLEFTGEVRGDYLPAAHLRNIQKYIKELLANDNLEEIEIVIPVKIIKK